MNKKANIAVLVLIAVVIVLFSILYFTSYNTAYLMIALLCIGILNIVNGAIAMKSGARPAGVVLLAGGVVLTIFMAVVLIVK